METATFAYIIANNNNEVVAATSTSLKNGAEVKFAYDACKENIDASRERNLVNAKWGRISRAKKWDKELYKLPRAEEIEKGEFLIQS